jgi:hypothetical protein
MDKFWKTWKWNKSTRNYEDTKIHIKLATTRNKNEQDDAKNNAELQTKWTKTTRKTFKESIRLSWNRSIKSSLITDDDDDASPLYPAFS